MSASELALEGAASRRIGAGWSAVRPREWLKNGFVVAPLLFSGRFDDLGSVSRSVGAFLAFCAIASAGYLVNDVRDRALDRRHPVKRDRMIASGRLATATALRMSALLAVTALAAAAAVGLPVVGMVVAYGLLSATYSLWLKRLLIFDVLALAVFFVLCVAAGSVAIEVTPSMLLLCCTIALALLLGFAKRRQELVSTNGVSGASRPVLTRYSLFLIDRLIALSVTATIICYAVYAFYSPLVGARMLVTVPAVVYGILRYLYLLYERGDQRTIAVIATRDLGIIGALAVWSIAVVVLIAGR